MKKVLLIIAHLDFQPLEYGGPKKVLSAAGVQVVTASDQGGIAMAAYTGEKVPVDLTLDQVKPAEYDGIFLIGGPGAPDYLNNEITYKIMREIAVSGKLWGAICISPRILAAAGVLQGKKATGWNGDGELGVVLEGAGAEYVREPVVDGKFITACGPVAAEDFGRAILQALE